MERSIQSRSEGGRDRGTRAAVSYGLPQELGVGRFATIGIPYPQYTARVVDDQRDGGRGSNEALFRNVEGQLRLSLDEEDPADQDPNQHDRPLHD